jgi:hypothetical protein
MVLVGSYNYFFGSEKELIEDRASLIHRWQARKIRTAYFNASSLYYLLWLEKQKYVRAAIKFDQTTQINTEFKPISYFYQLMLWLSYFSFPVQKIFTLATKINFIFLSILFLTFSFLLCFVLVPKKKLLATVSLLGFAGMGTQIITIYTFQSFHGYLYQSIGLLTALFMLGLALGAFFGQNWNLSSKERGLQAVILTFVIYLAILLFALKHLPLYLLSLLTAFPIGGAFSLVAKIMERDEPNIGKLSGLLYGADLLGSSLAAISVSIIFIPIYGMSNSLFITILCALGALLGTV